MEIYILIKYSVINNGWDIQIEQFHFIFFLSFPSVHKSNQWPPLFP